MARVLIVDDNVQIRKAMREHLSELKFTDIEEAGTGKQALNLCEKSLPDIITLDWNMPEMDGYDFLIALRKLENGDQPTVIFCSTEGRTDKINKVMSAGANDYIVKPVSLSALRDSLDQLSLLK